MIAIPAQAQDARERPVVVTVPPVRTVEAPPWQLARFTPGTPECADGAVTVTNIEAPFDWSVRAPEGAQADEVRLRFRIDASGRPLGIERILPDATSRPQPPGIDLNDLVPSFAAWRFAEGAPRDRCEIVFRPTLFPFGTAPDSVIARYLAGPHRRLPEDRELVRRLSGASGECVDTEVEPRTIAFPPFSALRDSPGGWSYVMLGYDIDARGIPADVRVVATDASRPVQEAAMSAVRRSRFAPRAVTGCTYPFYSRSGSPMPAPERPDKERFRSADARCEKDEDWVDLPPLRFPDGFETRSIEGWALVRYDVTEAGRTTNVEAVASEPAAAFGERGAQIVRGARQPGGEAKTGCLDYVAFKLPDRSPQ